MPRENLDRQIRHLQDEVLILGSMAEQAILKSVATLKDRDSASAAQIIANDRLINDKRYAIENAILILMATQQPMAHDLRLMAAILEIITELERIGDYAKGIAKATQRLANVDISIPIADLSKMADLAVDMLHRGLGAFVAEDGQMAHSIPDDDAFVDDLYNKVYHIVVNTMIRNPAIIDHANLLMWVAHNLERTADRVTNICERTVFINSGEMMEMDSEDNEETD